MIISFAVFDEVVTDDSVPPDGMFETVQPSVHEAVQDTGTENRTSISSTLPSWSVSSIVADVTEPENGATAVFVMAALQAVVFELLVLSPA